MTPNKQKIIAEPEELSKYFNKLYLLGAKNFNFVGQCPIRQIRESISVRQLFLKSSSFCSITLNQKDKRFFQEPLKYAYVWIRMIIIQKEYNGGYRWIDGRYDNQKTISI